MQSTGGIHRLRDTTFWRRPLLTNCDGAWSFSGLCELQPAGFESGECFTQHSVAEMPLRHAQEFRAAPPSMCFLQVVRRRDRVEIPSHEENAIRLKGNVVHRRAERKMAGDQRR